MEATVAALQTDVTSLKEQLDTDSAALAKTKTRLAELDSTLGRLSAVGEEELKRRSAAYM